MVILGLVAPRVGDANWPERLEQQREAFRTAWPLAAAGNSDAVKSNATLLSDYPLYPDLQAAFLRTQVGKVSDDEIRQFVAASADPSAVRDLRYRWAESLARRGLWEDYLDVYQTHYRGSSDQTLRCLALTARLRAGADPDLGKDALAFWLHGDSRPEECDPVFDWLDRQDYIDDDTRRQRIELALDEREFSLAAWLAKPLGEADQERVQRWRRMRHRPAEELSRTGNFADTGPDRDLLLYGIKRLARRDFEAATRHWNHFAERLSFEKAERGRMERDLAYAAAQDHDAGAVARILQLPPSAVDDRLLEWGVRVALREQDWQTALDIIHGMTPKTALKVEWRYWRARALEALGDTDKAEALYRDLSQSRGFYNFLAADRIEAAYAYNHVPAIADDELIDRLASNGGLVRAREMFFVDLNGRARSEWDRHVTVLSRNERAQSAIMASRWGWHSAAIKTASKAGLIDDLSLRYPIAFRSEFESNTSQLDLPKTWAFGIARSESLFMPDVSSSAGALGVMQLMPETGRLTARQARIRYRGRTTLLDPQQNIALGTYYLDKMYSRFDDNQVLATAAYNAGPHRVARWLPEDRPIAADIWVETVPYTETRNYLRRVLAADVIFHWRLEGETRRLAVIMPPVPAAAKSQRN